MDAQPHPDLVSALALSAQMLAAAGAGDWARASTLQGDCDRLIRGAPVNVAGLMAMRRLYQAQQALLAIAERERAAVGDRLARHRGNHRALSAYLHAADPG